MIVRWIRATTCPPSSSSTFCGRCQATFVGLTWNCMKRMNELPRGDVAELERRGGRCRSSRRPARARSCSCSCPSPQPGSSLRIAFFRSRLAVMWKRASHEVAATDRGRRVDRDRRRRRVGRAQSMGRWPNTFASASTRDEQRSRRRRPGGPRSPLRPTPSRSRWRFRTRPSGTSADTRPFSPDELLLRLCQAVRSEDRGAAPRRLSADQNSSKYSAISHALGSSAFAWASISERFIITR